MSDQSLELAGGALPAPSSIRAQLRRQLNEAVAVERARRGEVRLPEDVWPMFRALARVTETCGEYARAFQAAATEANAVAEEDLIEAVGEQDGTPNQGMTVPDADGDVKVSLDTANAYEFDRGALFNAVAYAVRAEHSVVGTLVKIMEMYPGHLEPQELEDRDAQVDQFVAHLLLAAMRTLCELGKFEPQITKVKAYAALLARAGDADDIVGTVTSSTRKRTIYKGVKITREAPK
jgi:hypothetical protein